MELLERREIGERREEREEREGREGKEGKKGREEGRYSTCGGFLFYLNPNVILLAKKLEEILSKILTSIFAENRIKWSEVRTIMFFRVGLCRLRAERWIKEIFEENEMEVQEKGSFMKEKNVVYVVFNLRSRKRYVGETGTEVVERWKGHRRDYEKESRRTYKRMRRVDWVDWLIMPVKIVQEKTRRIVVEMELIGKWRKTVINDDSTWFIRDKPRHKRGVNDRNRVVGLLSDKENWKGYDKEKMMKMAEMERGCHLPGSWHMKFREQVVKKMEGSLKKDGKKEKGWRVRYPVKFVAATEGWREVVKKLKNWTNELGWNKAEHIKDGVSVTMVGGKKIADVVKGTQKIKEIKFGEPRECRCKKYEGFKRNEAGHVRCKAGEIEGWNVLKKYLGANSKTLLALGRKEWEKEQKKLMIEFMEMIGIKKQKERTEWCIGQLIYKPNGKYREWELKQELRKLDGLCIFELDKNNMTWGVVCQEWYDKKLTETFDPKKMKQYEMRKESIEEMKVKVEKEFRKLKTKRVKKVWKESIAKVLPKDKDMERMRPLVSFFGHIGQVEGRIVARCINVMIRELKKKWRSWNIQKSTDMKGILERLERRDNWKISLEEEKITYFKYDIKNQFTNLDKKDVWEALEEGMKRLEWGKGKKNRYFSISRMKWNKKEDGLGKKKSGRFRNVEMERVMKYVKFEMENCYIVVGGRIVKQVGGLPMGGMVSAVLAELDAMWKEEKMKKEFMDKGVGQKIVRYRDDIRVFMRGKWGSRKAEEIRKFLGKVYGGSLEVEFEGFSREFVEFLDMKIFVEDGRFVITDFNKNVDFMDKNGNIMKMQKVRYPDPLTNWGARMIIRTLTGILFATTRRNNNLKYKFISVLQHLMEWRWLGYSNKIIEASGYGVSMMMGDLVRKMLAIWKDG